MSEGVGLPEGWTRARLDVICTKITDGTHHSPSQEAQTPKGDFLYITAKNIKESGVDLSNVTYLPGSVHRPIFSRCNPELGDILYIKDGATTGIATVNQLKCEFSLLSSVALLKPDRRLAEPRFIKWYLNSPQGYHSMTSQMGGTAIKRLTLLKINGGQVSLAPLPEQRRIVARIEELLSDLDAGVTALERAKTKLTRYRTSVLKAAVEGRLTEAWRSENPISEPASELLTRILAERRRRWEEDQLARYAAANRQPPKGWREKYREPEGPETEGLPPLPEGWCWATMDQLVARSEYGTSVKCDFEAKGLPVLRIPNIAAGQIDLTNLKFATADLALDDESSLRVGDMLMCRTNGSVSLLGKCAVVRQALTSPHAFASYLLRFRFVCETVLPRWVHLYCSSIAGRIFIESHAASSAGQHNISLSLMHSMPVPLPPLDEQAAALDAAEARTETADRTAEQFATNIRRSARLRQSILRRAFEGRLVPQDPADEAAEELLARIRAEREAAGNGKPQRQGKKRSTAKGRAT